MKKGFIPSEQIGLKKDFRKRLLLLQHELNKAIDMPCIDCKDCPFDDTSHCDGCCFDYETEHPVCSIFDFDHD